MIVNGGIAAFANKLMGTGSNFDYAHWGNGAASVLATHTALDGPETESRVFRTSVTRVTGPAPNVTNDTVQYIFRLTNQNAVGGTSKTITNFGQFNDPTAGDMILKEVLSPSQVVGGQEGIEFTVLLQVERGD